MPRRSRRHIVGKWVQIEQEAREDELKELERELHREWRRQRGSKRRPKTEDEPDTGTETNDRDGGR